MEGLKKNGGAREGAGRKPKRDEEKQKAIFESALKILTGSNETDESKVLFLVDFALEKDGKKFIAEHVFGKAKQIIDNNVNNIIEEKVGILFNPSK
jgi:hypothetical protein